MIFYCYTKWLLIFLFNVKMKFELKYNGEVIMELKILNSQKDIDLFKKLKSLLVNSNLSADKDDKCPNCNGNHIIKHGKRNNIQRYKCKSCSKVFSERCNSIISNTKVSLDKWFMYIALLINKISIRKCIFLY